LSASYKEIKKARHEEERDSELLLAILLCRTEGKAIPHVPTGTNHFSEEGRKGTIGGECSSESTNWRRKTGDTFETMVWIGRGDGMKRENMPRRFFRGKPNYSRYQHRVEGVKKNRSLSLKGS